MHYLRAGGGVVNRGIREPEGGKPTGLRDWPKHIQTRGQWIITHASDGWVSNSFVTAPIYLNKASTMSVSRSIYSWCLSREAFTAEHKLGPTASLPLPIRFPGDFIFN